MRAIRKYELAFGVVVFLIVAQILVGLHTIDRAEEVRHITGKATSSTGTVSVTIIGACSVPINQEFNFISFCSNFTSTNITDVLSGIDYDFVLEWSEGTQEFEIFSPEESNPPFTTFNLNKSYFIYSSSSSSQTLNIPGDKYGDLSLPLVQYFNSPTYPYRFTANVSTYLTSISNAQFMLKFNYTGQEFIIHSIESSDPDFTTIGRGDGQFIYVDNTDTLTYDKSALQ